MISQAPVSNLVLGAREKLRVRMVLASKQLSGQGFEAIPRERRGRDGSCNFYFYATH